MLERNNNPNLSISTEKITPVYHPAIVRVNRLIADPISIAINGDVCSGSSTLANALAERTHFRTIDIGQIIRHASKTIGYENQWEHLVRNWSGPLWDIAIDCMRIPGYIIEGRLVGLQAQSVPSALKILCVADETLRIQRLADRLHISVDQAAIEYEKRLEKDDNVLFAGWGQTRHTLFDPKLYDIIIDTSHHTPEDLATAITTLIESWHPPASPHQK